MRTLTIIPTYNEKENIEPIVRRVLETDSSVEVLVVDDNSPDGTGEIVDRMIESESRIHVLHRSGKQGLGKAYIAGFKKAIEMGVDRVIQMDADFSHNPSYLPDMLKASDSYDVVIGSRYMNGNISVVNWPLSRLILSYFANIYARWVTGLPVFDVTGGFKVIRTDVLRNINLDKISSNGYAFQIEINYIFNKKGFSITEIPIIFTDREGGVSKMSRRIMLEAVFKIWLYRFRKY
ncbi:MAG: polyprenol monophosphomannose synthase [Acidiferrobacterales bacterium]